MAKITRIRESRDIGFRTYSYDTGEPDFEFREPRADELDDHEEEEQFFLVIDAPDFEDMYLFDLDEVRALRDLTDKILKRHGKL